MNKRDRKSIIWQKTKTWGTTFIITILLISTLILSLIVSDVIKIDKGKNAPNTPTTSQIMNE